VRREKKRSALRAGELERERDRERERELLHFHYEIEMWLAAEMIYFDVVVGRTKGIVS
jgi:hypothetical protein